MSRDIIKVKNFLGLHEEAHGHTTLKLGEASRMENFYITDGGNLTVRPGCRLQYVYPTSLLNRSDIIGAWSGYFGEFGDDEFLIIAEAAQTITTGGCFTFFQMESGELKVKQRINFPEGSQGVPWVNFFTFKTYLYAISPSGFWKIRRENDGFSLAVVDGYIPTVLINTKPAGGGTPLQNINRLSNKRRVKYDGDGTSKSYVLPEEAEELISVTVEGTEISCIFSQSAHTVGLTNAPAKGINNVEIVYSVGEQASKTSRQKVLGMKYAESYNGQADTRIFLYGDSTNICIYSGLTEAGDPTAEYFPELFEVAVDATDSPITGMCRYQSHLLVFKSDGTFAISYDTATLADGTTVPAFFVRAINRSIGNQAPGQVQSVLNYPRTIANHNIYDWKLSTYYQDERSAKVVSDRVSQTLQGIDASKVTAFDDNEKHDYYLFLNDASNTVLVHRYEIDVWLMYKGIGPGKVGDYVKFAGKVDGTLCIVNSSGYIFSMDDVPYDLTWLDTISGEETPIKAVWESGYMDFGADYMRKNSSYLWVPMHPEPASRMTVTCSTDKRDQYVEKVIGANYMGYGNVDYNHWSYSSSRRPRVFRVKIKTKKFVWHKVIFRVDSPGSRATVLGFDVDVRTAGYAK